MWLMKVKKSTTITAIKITIYKILFLSSKKVKELSIYTFVNMYLKALGWLGWFKEEKQARLLESKRVFNKIQVSEMSVCVYV